MKTFKEFQTESYSRLDEGWGGKIASELWKRSGGALTGNMLYKTVAPDLRGAMPGKDGQKIKSTKTNTKGEVASTAIGAFGDQIVKKGWKYGVKPGWNRVAKPALTGAYNVGKWGVTKALPTAGAVTLAALKQVFGGGVDRI